MHSKRIRINRFSQQKLIGMFIALIQIMLFSLSFFNKNSINKYTFKIASKSENVSIILIKQLLACFNLK